MQVHIFPHSSGTTTCIALKLSTMLTNYHTYVDKQIIMTLFDMEILVKVLRATLSPLLSVLVLKFMLCYVMSLSQ